MILIRKVNFWVLKKCFAVVFEWQLFEKGKISTCYLCLVIYVCLSRGRKIIWFNPPFNNSVKTNVGRKFLGLVKKNFPRNHRYHQIFNRNTLKLSYCCTSNLGNIIKQHNSKILKGTPAPQLQQCNCRTKQNCPLNGRCLTNCIVYKATVTTNSDTHTYYGLCEGEFKSRYYNHTKSFVSKIREWNRTLEISLEIERRIEGLRLILGHCCLRNALQMLDKALWPLSSKESLHNQSWTQGTSEQKDRANFQMPSSQQICSC